MLKWKWRKDVWAAKKHCSHRLPPVRLQMNPGKWMSTQFGVVVLKVLSVVESVPHEFKRETFCLKQPRQL